MTTSATTDLVAGTWDIDPVHSEVAFAVRHMMVSKVRGRFGAFTGTIVTAADLLGSSVTAEIELDSLDTGNEQRDAHVKSSDFLDAARFPTMGYRSTALRTQGSDYVDYVLDGELTLHGATRPVSLDLEVTGSGPDAHGGTRAGFSASGTINRRDFGIDISLPLESGGVVVADKIQIQLDIQAVLRTE